MKIICDSAEFSKEKFGNVDIWINNAGVNQPEKAIWELTETEIDLVFDVDFIVSIVLNRKSLNG